MILKIKRFKTDIIAQAFYKESMIGLAKEDSRLALIRRLQSVFGIRLDMIKFNAETPSGNFIHFTKGFGSGLFSLSFGLEEATANLWDAQSGEQIGELYGGMFKILEEIPLRSLRVNLSRHFTTEGDLESYLRHLNPAVPQGFDPLLSGRGAFYHLEIKDQGLKAFVTIVNSLLVTKGLFLGIDFQFEPFTQDFRGVIEILSKHDGFILKELMLEEA